MNRSDFFERRRHPRVAVEIPLEIDGDEGRFTARIVDLSRAGIGLVSPVSFDEEALLGVAFRVEGRDGRPDVAVDATAVVVRNRPHVRGGFFVALYFLEIAEEMRESLDAYVREVAVALR